MVVNTVPGRQYILTEWYLGNYPYILHGLHILLKAEDPFPGQQRTGYRIVFHGRLTGGRWGERQDRALNTGQTAQGILSGCPSKEAFLHSAGVGSQGTGCYQCPQKGLYTAITGKLSVTVLACNAIVKGMLCEETRKQMKLSGKARKSELLATVIRGRGGGAICLHRNNESRFSKALICFACVPLASSTSFGTSSQGINIFIWIVTVYRGLTATWETIWPLVS